MHSSRDDYRRFHERRHRVLLDLLDAHISSPVERCLDIGGGGDVADAEAALRERFARELHAVDLGADVELGRRKGIQAETCDVDKEPLPYPDGHFDLVLFASVIEHVYNPHHVLTEIARVTKPGGLLLLETPNAVAFGRRLDALFGRNPYRQFNQYNAVEDKAPMAYCSVFYTLQEIETALAPEFTVIDRRYGMHSPPVNPLKALAREAVFRLAPRMGDFFAFLATRALNK